MEKNKTIEQSLDEIDSIIEQLSDNSNSLEDMFKLYEKGIALVGSVKKRIDKVEKDMIILEEGQ